MSVRAAALALRSKQAPRFQSLIPQFHRIRDVPSLDHLGPHKVLDTFNFTGAECGNVKYKVGFYHTMNQFVRLAKMIKHPTASQRPLGDDLVSLLFRNLKDGPAVVALHRAKFLAKVAQMKSELKFEEARFHAWLPPHAREVLKGKSLLVWHGF